MKQLKKTRIIIHSKNCKILNAMEKFLLPVMFSVTRRSLSTNEVSPD